MTFAETIAKSQKLDTFLKGNGPMPEIAGSTKLSLDLGTIFDGIRKEMDIVKADIAAASNELVAEIQGGKNVAKALRAEAVTVRKTFAQVLGNAEGTTTDTQQAKT